MTVYIIDTCSRAVICVLKILGILGMSSLLKRGVTMRSTMVTMQYSSVLYRGMWVLNVY